MRTGARAPTDAAVVIGIEAYGDLPQVPYAEADAQAFGDFLRYTRGLPGERITRLVGKVNRQMVEQAVGSAGASVPPGGTLWVYFAGHGAASTVTRERLLLGWDTLASADSFDSHGVAVDELRRDGASGGGQVVVVVDACYGGAGRDGSAKAGGRWAVPVAATRAPGVEWVAAQPNEVAAPLVPAGHGAFTYFVLGALRGWADGAIDGRRDGTVTGDEADAFVQIALRATEVRGQTPALSGEGARTLVLASGAREATPDFSGLTAPLNAIGSASTTDGTKFAATAATDTAEKVRQQKCDDTAQAEGQRRRDATLAKVVSTVQSSAAAAWAPLGLEAEQCVQLRDMADRSSCADRLDAFLAQARAATASLAAGEETVATECGLRTRAYDAVTTAVTIPEVATAASRARQLRQAPASVSATSAASGTASIRGSASCYAVVNINTADVDGIQQLPGVGPTKAAMVLEYRAANGPFTSCEGLDYVPGIGPASLAVILPCCSVE